MADTSSHSQPTTPQLVEEYMAIVKRHGVASEDARRFRNEHPNCPGLDDVDAAYRAAEEARRRQRSRGCLLSLIAVFVTCIAAYGIVFASRAGLLNKKVAEVSKDKAKTELVLGKTTIELDGTKKVLTTTKGQLESTTKRLDNTARQRDAAKNLRNEFDKINGVFLVASNTDLPDSTSTASVMLKIAASDDATAPVDIALEQSDSESHVTQNEEAIDQITIESAENPKTVDLRVTELRPNEVRTVVVATSSGSVSPSAVTVIVEELTNEPKPIELHLVTPAYSPEGATVSLRSSDPSVTILVDGEPADQVVVPEGQTAVRFRASSSKTEPGGVSHIIATVDGASPFLVRARPATSVTPAKVIGEVTGIPQKAIGGATPIAATVNLTNSSTAASQVKLTSTNPNVSFRSNGMEGATLTVTANGLKLPFEIVTTPVAQHEVADVAVNYGDEQKHVAFLLSPPPEPTPSFGAIEVPSTPLSSGEKLELSIPVAKSFTAEDIKLVKVDGDGIQFSTPKLDANRLTIEGTIQTVDEVRILPVTVSLGDHKVTSTVTAKPIVSTSNEVILPSKLTGVPESIVSDGKASTVSIKLPKPITDPNGATFSLSSSSPNVVFRSNDQETTSIPANPSDDRLQFEIVANGIEQTEAVSITISHGNHQRSVALLVTAPPQTDPIEDIALPTKHVVSGETFTASIKLPAELTDDQREGINLTTDAKDVLVVRQAAGTNSKQVDFQVTAPSVTEPQLLHVSASVGDPDSPTISTKPLILLPKGSVRPALVSVEVDPSTGEGKVTLDREAGDYRQVVFLESNSSTVMVPEFVLINPESKSAAFSIVVEDDGPSSEVQVTATLEDQSSETTFVAGQVVDPTGLPAQSVTAQPTTTSHRCPRRIRWTRRR